MKKGDIITLVKKAMDEKIFAGFCYMGLAPRIQNKIEKAGVPTENSQQLMTLLSMVSDGVYRFIAFIKGKDQQYYAGVMTVWNNPNPEIIRPFKVKWEGYIPLKEIKEAL